MKISILLLTLTLLLIACTPTDAQIQAAIEETTAAQAIDMPADPPIPTNTNTPADTPTPTITSTLLPTRTVGPTRTQAPTNTPTPKPEPISISGDTDSVVDVDKWEGPAIARITYSGRGNFSIINYGPNNTRYNLLVNTIGDYSGTVAIDFIDGENTRRFEVSAGGPWEIEILPLSEARRERIPGTISGSGDDVIILVGSNPDMMIVDGSQARSNFAIWAYGNRRNLALNVIAPYEGTVLLERDTAILEISEGGGQWSIEITTQ